VPPPAGSGDESESDDFGIGDESGDTGADSTDDWKTEVARIQSELELFEAESTAFEAREADVSAWMAKKNGARLKSLESKMKSPARSRDLAGVRSATSQAKPLREELRAVLQNAITAALSDANQAAWQAILLRDRLVKLMEPLQLTAERLQQIHTEGDSVVQATAGEVNPEASGFLELAKNVESRILTPEQKTAYEPIKKKSPMRSLY